MGPEHLLDSKSRGLNRLTEKMTAFYEQFKQEDVVKIDDPGFLEGKKLILESGLVESVRLLKFLRRAKRSYNFC